MLKKLMISVVMAGLALPSFAMTLIEARPGELSEIKVSKDEFTLIGIKDSVIARIDGENFIDNVEKDRGFGKAFIKPATMYPFTIYVTDIRGRTFPIFITPDPALKGAVFEIVDSSPVQEIHGNDSPVFGQGLNRNTQIKNLLKAMMLDKRPNDMTVRVSEAVVPWWEESQLLMTHEYEHRDMIGYVFVLKNVSVSEMVLNEAEFQVKDAIAASIQHAVLKPGEETKVFVIVQNKENL
ncbi:MAG: type-F conjugative transfer system secretin TraK [Methyloprofundus sp.]|nr:type-F conjugative transfer system secretin TraK [Methyloprofundus sp.]